MLSSWRPSPQGWKGAALGVFFATLFLGLLATFELFKSNVDLGQSAAYYAMGSLITAMIGAALVFLWLGVSHFAPLSKWLTACFAFLIYYFFIPSQIPASMGMTAIWAVLSFSLTGGALWELAALLNNKNDETLLRPLIYLALGLLGIGTLAWWLSFTT